MKTINLSRKTLLSLTALLLLAALTFALALPAFADVTYPTPTEYIADDAGILSESTVQYLRETNTKLISEIKSVLSVCTVKSTNGIDIGKYARAVYTEWKLPSGILLVIATDDESFYIVPSESVSQVIGNEELEAVRDQYIEEDFNAGEYDRAIRKGISQLSSLMLQRLKTEEETTAVTNSTTPEQNEEKSAGSAIVKFLKTILIIVLIALALFILLFVIAMFNENVAAFMQKYIFRRGSSQKPQNHEQYYDERLYGSSQNQNQQRRPNPNGQNRQYNNQNQYRQQSQYNNYNNQYNQQNRNYPQQQNPNRNYNAQQNGQIYYNADGTVRQQNPNRQRQANTQNRQQNGYNQANYSQQRNYNQQANYNNQTRQNPSAQNSYNQNADAGETRQYTIPNQYDR